MALPDREGVAYLESVDRSSWHRHLSTAVKVGRSTERVIVAQTARELGLGTGSFEGAGEHGADGRDRVRSALGRWAITTGPAHASCPSPVRLDAVANSSRRFSLSLAGRQAGRSLAPMSRPAAACGGPWRRRRLGVGLVAQIGPRPLDGEVGVLLAPGDQHARPPLRGTERWPGPQSTWSTALPPMRRCRSASRAARLAPGALRARPGRRAARRRPARTAAQDPWSRWRARRARRTG